MKGLLYIINQNDNKTLSFEVLYNAQPEHIYEYIKSKINNNKKSKQQITFEFLVSNLLSRNEYTNNIEMGIEWIDYYIKVIYNNEYITILGYEANNYINNVECFNKKIIITVASNGNCIDDFIKRGIEPLLSTITDYKKSIKSRKRKRTKAIEYHSTACYEHDFNDIIQIKKNAEKIVENCNKHLERISEFYTKLK